MTEHPTAPASSSRPEVAAALRRGGIIDITTTGRHSGEPRRIEIVFFAFDGRVYISGMPGPRSWYANLLEEPRFTFHLKDRVVADLSARARPVTDPSERRAVLARVTRIWRRESQLQAFVAGSPLVEVTFDHDAAVAA